MKPRLLHGRDIKAKRVYRCADCGWNISSEAKKFGTWGCPMGHSGNKDRCNIEHFASKGELQRYYQLELLEKVGDINQLTRQLRATLLTQRPDGTFGKVGKIVIDFVYFRKGERIYEDYHPVHTPLSKWKYKHFEIQYGKPLLITGA